MRIMDKLVSDYDNKVVKIWWDEKGDLVWQEHGIILTTKDLKDQKFYLTKVENPNYSYSED